MISLLLLLCFFTLAWGSVYSFLSLFFFSFSSSWLLCHSSLFLLARSHRSLYAGSVPVGRLPQLAKLATHTATHHQTRAALASLTTAHQTATLVEALHPLPLLLAVLLLAVEATILARSLLLQLLLPQPLRRGQAATMRRRLQVLAAMMAMRLPRPEVAEAVIAAVPRQSVAHPPHKPCPRHMSGTAPQGMAVTRVAVQRAGCRLRLPMAGGARPRHRRRRLTATLVDNTLR